MNPVSAADLVQLNLILNCPLQSKALKFVHQMKLDKLSYILWGTSRAIGKAFLLYFISHNNMGNISLNHSKYSNILLPPLYLS